MDRLANYINGELAAPGSGVFLENIEPATGHVYGEVPGSDKPDVGRAVEAAEAAFGGWSTTPAAERARVLSRIADLVEANYCTVDADTEITVLGELFRRFKVAVVLDGDKRPADIITRIDLIDYMTDAASKGV